MGIASRRISPSLGDDSDLPVVGLAGQKLAQTIERVVRERIGGKIQGLKVEVRREGVFLQGVCPTFYVKQLAQHSAMQVAGQLAITNEIKVI
jgi:osmotically-inducible protein OsmY